MTNLRNSVQLIGRLGKDPEVRTLEGGRMMATFSLATSEVYRNAKGEKVEETQWHNIIAWGVKAEIASKYLKKGKEVAVEGKIIYRAYEANNGEKKYFTQINVHEILMLDKKSE